MVNTDGVDHGKFAFDGTKLDRRYVERFIGSIGAVFRGWFRSEVKGMERLPAQGAALLVSNHSGGMITPDVMLVGSAYYTHFGYRGRPLYALAHSAIFRVPFTGWLERLGAVHASRSNAVAALKVGGAVLVFPGGDYDCYRPSSADHTVDFNGRTGYVKTAIATGVPIVPIVSIGAQETHLFVSRGAQLATALKLDRVRLGILPITFGFPFGLTLLGPPNVPLPSKIVTHVLDPIDIAGTFGEDADVDEVDAHVRSVMQAELDRMASARRFPVLG